MHDWRGMPSYYWLTRLVEEVGELAQALTARHEHSPDYELLQIASIAINWLDNRNADTGCRDLPKIVQQAGAVYFPYHWEKTEDIPPGE